MLAADGTMLHCSNKIALMSILEQLPTGKDDNSAIDQDDGQGGI